MVITYEVARKTFSVVPFYPRVLFLLHFNSCCSTGKQGQGYQDKGQNLGIIATTPKYFLRLTSTKYHLLMCADILAFGCNQLK